MHYVKILNVLLPKIKDQEANAQGILTKAIRIHRQAMVLWTGVICSVPQTCISDRQVHSFQFSNSVMRPWTPSRDFF
jgi:hypothetical protein